MEYTEELSEIVFLNDKNIVHTLGSDGLPAYNALPSLSLLQSCYVDLCSHSDQICSDLCNTVIAYVEASCSNLSNTLTTYVDSLSTKLSNEVCEHLSGSLSDYTDQISVELSVNICKQLSVALSGYSDSLCSQLCTEIEEHYLKNDNDVFSGTLSILDGIAIGKNATVSADANNSIAIGHNAQANHHNSFVWNGSDKEGHTYESWGDHTFSINPAAGLCGIYVGENTLCDLISTDTALSINSIRKEADTKYALTSNTYTKNAVNEISLSLSSAVSVKYALSADVYSQNEIDDISAALSNAVSSQHYVKRDNVKFEYNYANHALNLSIQDGTVLSVSTNQFEVGRFINSVRLSSDAGGTDLSIDIEFVLDSTTYSTQHILIPIKQLTQIYTAGYGIEFEQLSDATYKVNIADTVVATRAYCVNTFAQKTQYETTSATVAGLQAYANQLSTPTTGTIDTLSNNISMLQLADVRKLKFTHVITLSYSDLISERKLLSALLNEKKAAVDDKIQNGAVILVKFTDDLQHSTFGLSYVTVDDVVLGDNDFIVIRDIAKSTTEIDLHDLVPNGDGKNVFVTNAVHRYEYENLSTQLSTAIDTTNSHIDYVSAAVDNKICIDGISAESLCAQHINADEFHDLVLGGGLLSNVIYVVSSDYVNAYDQLVKNVKAPESDTDAANKKYVDGISAELNDDIVSVRNFAEDTLSGQLCAISCALKAADDKLSDAISSKIFVDGTSIDTLSVTHINNEKFYERVAAGDVQKNVMYIVSGDYVNAYDRNIKYMLDPIEDQDASTKKYVDDHSMPSLKSTIQKDPVLSGYVSGKIGPIDINATSLSTMLSAAMLLFNTIANS